MDSVVARRRAGRRAGMAPPRCRKKKPRPAPPKITVTAATAKKGDIGVYFDAIGAVTPVYTDSITSQVNGLVRRRAL